MNSKPKLPVMNTFSVSELNRHVRAELETTFGDVWVEGELSNLVRPASGHWYFSLKDSNAQISCALFKGQRLGLAIALSEIDNGLAVRAHGRVSLYEPRGSYQLIIDQLEPAGIGILEQAYKARQAALAAEGLFDVKRKKPVPKRPTTIGIITSASGAAIHDALTTLKRRQPFVPIIIYPSLVQGEDAPAQLIQQIVTANRRAECDVLLLIRGGGSLEDLWAFNHPDLVRCIAASDIPIISGIGHEVDMTLADLAADLRAPTPTAAAEQATPAINEDIASCTNRLNQLQHRLQQYWYQQLRQLTYLQHRLQQQNPQHQLQKAHQRCDEHAQHLIAVLQQHYLQKQQDRLNQYQYRLHALAPLHRVQHAQAHLERLQQRLYHAVQYAQKHHHTQLTHLMQRLHALSPLNILERGYAVALDANGQIIRCSQDVQAGARIQLRLGQGRLYCTVTRRTKQ